MDRLFAAVLLAAALALSAGAAKAMPLASDGRQDSLIVPVADGCGVNRYRDAHDVCRRKYYFTRRHPKQFYGACAGSSAHRVCNFFGQCWMVCD